MKPQKKNRSAIREDITEQVSVANKINQNKRTKTKKSTDSLSSAAARTLVDVAPVVTDLSEDSGIGDKEAGIELVDDPDLNETVCSDGALEGSLHPADSEMSMEKSETWKTKSGPKKKKKRARNISQDGPDVDVGVGNLIGSPSSLNRSTVPEDMGDATVGYQTQKAARTPSEKKNGKKRMIVDQNKTDTNSLSLMNKIKNAKHDKKKKKRKDSLTSTAEGTPVDGPAVFIGFQAPVENALENITGDGEAGVELGDNPVAPTDLETGEPICSDLQPTDSESKNLKSMNEDVSEMFNTKDRMRIKKKMEKRARKSRQDRTYDDEVGNLVERSSSPNLAAVPEGMGGVSVTVEYETNEGPQLNKEPCSDIILEGSHVVDDQMENPNSKSAGASHICKTKNGQKKKKKNQGRKVSQVGTDAGVGSLVDLSSSSPNLSTGPDNSKDVCAAMKHQVEAAETLSEKQEKKSRKKKKRKRNTEEVEGTNSASSLNLSTEEIRDGITDNSEMGNLCETRHTHCESDADQTGGGLERDDSNIKMGRGKGNSSDDNLPPVKRKKKKIEQQSVAAGMESQEMDLEAQDAPRECENLSRNIVTADESTLLKHLEPGEFTHTKKKSHKKNKRKRQRVGYDVEMQGPHLSPPNTCDLLVDGGNEYPTSKKDIKDTDVAELRELRTKKKKCKRKLASEEMEGILSPTCELYVDGRWETIGMPNILAESDTAEQGESRIVEKKSKKKKQCITDEMEAQGMRSSLTACKSSLDGSISLEGILVNGGGLEKPTKKKDKKKNQNDRQEMQGLRPTSVGESLAGEVTTGEIQKRFGTSGENESVRPEALVDLSSESNSAGDLLQGVIETEATDKRDKAEKDVGLKNVNSEKDGTKQGKKEKRGKNGKQETTSSVLAWQLSEQTSERKGEKMPSSGNKTKCQINVFESLEDNGKPAKKTLLSMTSIEKGKGKSANADSRKCKRKLFNSALYEMFDSTKTD
ncbi:uncharacterized protein LOC121308124 isoform X2 [Polyodon spathula]|nr:uncharacterized protein LOC121308124 isoform X2 [Polyodon spathula]